MSRAALPHHILAGVSQLRTVLQSCAPSQRQPEELPLTSPRGSPSVVWFCDNGSWVRVPLGLGEGVHVPSRSIVKGHPTAEQLLSFDRLMCRNRAMREELVSSGVGPSTVLDQLNSVQAAETAADVVTMLSGLIELGPNFRVAALETLPFGNSNNPPAWTGQLPVSDGPSTRDGGVPLTYCPPSNTDGVRFKLVLHEDGERPFPGFRVGVGDANAMQVYLNYHTGNSQVCPWVEESVISHSPGYYGSDQQQQMGRTDLRMQGLRIGDPDVRLSSCFALLLLALRGRGTLLPSPACPHKAFKRRIQVTRFSSIVSWGSASAVLNSMRQHSARAAPLRISLVCSVASRLAYLAGGLHAASEQLCREAAAQQLLNAASKHAMSLYQQAATAAVVHVLGHLDPTHRLAVQAAAAPPHVRPVPMRERDEAAPAPAASAPLYERETEEWAPQSESGALHQYGLGAALLCEPGSALQRELCDRGAAPQRHLEARLASVQGPAAASAAAWAESRKRPRISSDGGDSTGTGGAGAVDHEAFKRVCASDRKEE